MNVITASANVIQYIVSMRSAGRAPKALARETGMLTPVPPLKAGSFPEISITVSATTHVPTAR